MGKTGDGSSRDQEAGALKALNCRVCGAAMTEESLAVDASVVTCRYCGAMYSGPGAGRLAGLEARPRRPLLVRRREQRRDVSLPDRFRIDRTNERLVISWPWFGPSHGWLAFLSLFLTGMLIFWFYRTQGIWDVYTKLLVPLIFGAPALVAWYLTLMFMMNRTRLTISSDRLDIRHGPVPAMRSVSIAASDLDQLYAKKNDEVYELRAILRDGRGMKLLGGLGKPEQALWLEQEIESCLGIEDDAVAGEA